MFGDRRRVRAAAELLRRWGLTAPEPDEVPAAMTPAAAPPQAEPAQPEPEPQAPVGRPPGGGSTLAAMDGDVNQTLGELERRLKELERELEAVGRAGEVDAEPAQGGWTPPSGDGVAPPPPGTTPFTATWSGTGAAQPAGEPAPPPTPQGAPPIPVRPPYWQPVTPPAAEPAPAPETPAADVRWSPPEQPAPASQQAAPAPHQPAWAPAPAQAAPEPAAPAHAAAPAARPAEPTAATAGLHRQLDELLAFRERLVTSTNQLVDELSRVLDDLGVELQAEEPAQPDPADTVLSGDVVVEAGPFPDLATLAAFEQALQRTDGVARVHVRTLDEGQATIDVALDEPTRLAAALRERAVVDFAVEDVSESRLVLTVA